MIRYVLVALFFALPLQAQEWVLSKRISLQSDDPRMGGLSALHVEDDGAQFLAISDRGVFIKGMLPREGRDITDVVFTEFEPIRQINGDVVQGRSGDVEGLAVDQDGGIYLSFEGFARVRKHSSIYEAAQDIPGHKHFKKMQTNSSLEALAIDQKGRLFTLPERSGKLDRPFPVYMFANGRWRVIADLPRRGDHLASGADFGPDGRFYLLERDFQTIAFGTRVRSWAMKGNQFVDERIEIETDLGDFGNFEGLSIWKDAEGQLRMTLVTDNNYMALLRNELVEFKRHQAVE